MASLVSIWNLALSHLGNKAGLSTTSEPYSSREAELCGQFWPIARQFAIVKCKPSWARRRVSAALLDLGTEQPTQWLYTYSKPENCLELIGIYEPEAVRDEDRQPCRVETWTDGADNYDVIYANVEEAVVRWLSDEESPDRNHPAFVNGVSYLLAAYIAGPIVKGKAGMDLAEALEKKALSYLMLSETHDANQNSAAEVFRDGNHAAPWISARGFGDVVLADAAVLNGQE